MTVSQIEQELERIKSCFDAMKKKIVRQQSVCEAIQRQSEQEIKRYQAAPPSADREHYLRCYQLRRALSLKSSELFNLILQTDPSQVGYEKNLLANKTRVADLNVLIRYLATDYAVTQYGAIVEAIGESLGAKRKANTGPLGGQGLAARSPSGPLPQRTGTGSLNPPLLPPHAPKTRPLNAESTGVPARAQSGPLPGRGTGSLNGSGPLSAPRSASGPLKDFSKKPFFGPLRQAIAVPETRNSLEQIVQTYQEIDLELRPLRGPELTTLTMPAAQTDALLNKLNGKIYYLKRHIQQTGTLAADLAFDGEGTDGELQTFLTNLGNSPVGQGEKVSITERLKSFFGR
jgi:hypothetical protein